MLNAFLFIYFISFVHFSTSEKLIFASLHSRHGTRAPLNCDDNNIDYLGEKWTNPGQLTPSGHRMEYILGLRNRQRYINGGKYKFLSDKFDPHEILVFSSNVNRTILSISSQIQGLYPLYSKSGFELTEKQLNVSYPPVNYLYDEILNEINNLNLSALPKYMTLIPIHITTSSERRLNALDSSGCKDKVNKTRENNKMTNEKVVNAALEFNKKYSENLGKYYDKNGKDFKYDFNWMSSFCSTLVSDISDGRTMDDFFKRTGINSIELLNDCKYIILINFRDDFFGDKNNDVILLSESKLIKEVLYYMKLKIDEDMKNENIPLNVSDYSKPKMLIYSGHDSTLTAEELFMIKFFNLKTEYSYPSYATQLAFEVTRDEKREILSYSSYKVTFYFNEDILMEKNFEEFKNVIEKNIWSDDKVSEYCDGKKKFDNKNKNTVQLFAIIGLFTIIIISFIIIICLVDKIKNMKR